MPRYVLLRHECPPSFGKPSHWDLMFEWGDALRTWDLRELPAAWADALQVDGSNSAVAAIALPDHRLTYLDFEGPLTNDRGSVRRCDVGTYTLLGPAPPEQSPKQLQIALNGQLLRGEIRIELAGKDWTLTAVTD